MLTGEAPGWVYINAAICLQVYGILDAADGKQARRIHASSPLGQIFDHGCDAVNLIFIIISSCSGSGLRIGKTTSYTIIMMCGCFACAQLLPLAASRLQRQPRRRRGVVGRRNRCSPRRSVRRQISSLARHTDFGIHDRV